ncbi:MAG: DUF378 domain-containing protein [Nanoarchaeota archaeon]
MSWYSKTALVLANIAAINWGLFAFDFNLVDLAFGTWPTVATVVYVILALCGVYGIIKLFK